MTRRAVPLAVAACAVVALAGCADGAAPAGGALATVRLGLSADLCADYCVVGGSVTAYRDGDPFPIGPPEALGCGGEAVIDGLPAGHRVVLEAELRSVAGDTVLQGESEVITVLAGTSIEAVVPLTAVSPPAVTAVTPDPVIPGDAGAAITISGAAFGAEAGAWGVELDGASLSVTSWSDDTVVASLPARASGQDLRVRSCGVASAPFPVRLVGAALDRTPVPLAPGCTGRVARAAARDDAGDVWVAFRCAPPQLGYLQRFTATAGCPVEDAEVWAVAGEPVDVAVAAGVAWLALEGAPALTRVELATGDVTSPVALPEGREAQAVAVVGGGDVYAIARGHAGATLLVRSDGASPAASVADVDADLALFDLVADDRYVYVSGASGSAGKLVGVPLGDGVVTEWSLPGCEAPGALAVGAGGRVAIACGDRVLGFEADGLGLAAADLPAGASTSWVAFDARGDVALVVDPGAAAAHLVPLEAASGAALASWAVGEAGEVGALARIGAEHRFLAGVGDGLEAWAPYGVSACPAVEGP